jgi:Skp family chaperone for outer membrane proteins
MTFYPIESEIKREEEKIKRAEKNIKDLEEALERVMRNVDGLN